MNRLKPFAYFEPTTLPEAIEILAAQEDGAFLFAGGTDLLVRMKRGVIKPSAIVNLKRIEGLDQIKKEPGRGVRIGALATFSAIENSHLLRLSHPVIAQAVSVLACPSIRNLATMGGNIGRASPASDAAPFLMILSAIVSLKGPQGERELGMGEIFSGPGTTALRPAEAITSLFLPDMATHSGAAYLKIGRREGMDCALAGVAASVTLSGAKIEAKDTKIALSAVAPVPMRAKKAEEAILSERLTEKCIREAAKLASEEISPVSDMRASASYRREVVRVLTYRALMIALQQAREG